MNFTILKFDTIESTNTEALNQARRGADEGLCITARRQTAGRGRHGRSWISEKDAGLYFSIVLRPKIELKFLTLITLLSAAAVHDALEKLYQIDCDIKWVNDIHVNDKKICGILAETAETDKGLAVVVGIGINLKSSNFPDDVAETATSVETETGKTPDAEKLISTLTGFLKQFYAVLNAENGAENIRNEWIRRSSYAFGKPVTAKTETETITGETCGIGENGSLRIKTQTCEIRIINSGEIQRLRQTQW